MGFLSQFTFEGIVIALVILGWLLRTVFQGIGWIISQIKGVGVAPSSLQQAIYEAQRQQPAIVQGPPPPKPARIRPRRPDAGGPAVPREAKREDFDRSETELLSIEPSPLTVPLGVANLVPSAPSFRLFSNTDDLIRAVILQEVLGPPLSHRSSSPKSPAP